jgi:dihydroorotase
MPRRVLFRGVRLVDPASGHDGVTNVLVEEETVAAVGPEAGHERAEAIDAAGLVMAPGLVDLHAHLREPGFEHKETIESGTRAAAAGGYTAVCAMPNTDPVIDNAAVVAEVRALADKAGFCEVLPAAGITRGLEGEALTDMAELAAAGVRLFTDDGACVRSSRVTRLALEYARPLDVIICQHAQDDELTQGWQMHEGYYSAMLGLAGAPSAAESVVVGRDLALARLTGGRLHLTHLSALESVELVRHGKGRGVRVSADVTPHHLALTDEDLLGYDTNLKVNPPLRTPEDRQVLREALAEGTIDAVATDHAPHAPEEKEQEFDQAPPGTIGLETALAVVLTELVEPEVLSLLQAVERLSTTPARMLGLDDHGGPVSAGRRVRGRVVHTLLNGTFTVREGDPVS